LQAPKRMLIDAMAKILTSPFFMFFCFDQQQRIGKVERRAKNQWRV
jgi:hypothetical protein